MKLDFRIDWGYQCLYTRVSYHPEFIWDGELLCQGGRIERCFHLAYPYVVFGPGHSAVEEPLPAPRWSSRTRSTFDGMRFEAEVSDDAQFTLATRSGDFSFTAGELLQQKHLLFPIGPKYLNCHVIVTLTGHYWFQRQEKANERIWDADDLSNVPVRDWARMRTAWLASGGKVEFVVDLPKKQADFVEWLLHLVIMAAPFEYTPGNEQQVEDFFPIELQCDGKTVAKRVRYLRAHDTRMQLLEDEWLRFQAVPGKHTLAIVNRHPAYHLLINRMSLRDSSHGHLELSLPHWALTGEQLFGRIFATHEECASVSWPGGTAQLSLALGWNEFSFSICDAGHHIPVTVESGNLHRHGEVEAVYALQDEIPEVTVGYDMTVVPHDDNGDMDWLLDYTVRSRLGNLVVFRNFIDEETNGGLPTPVSDDLLSRWGAFCRKHHLHVVAASDFESGTLAHAASEMYHSAGKHEATFPLYALVPSDKWRSTDMKEAMEHAIECLRIEVDRAHKTGTQCSFGDPSGAHRYAYMAGADYLRAETMVPHTQHLLSQARPAAEVFRNGHWGVHIAIQHAMQPFFENHLGIYYLSLMQPWAMGADMFYEEDSLFEMFKEERQAWDDALTKGKRDMTRAFYHFVKTHPRRGRPIRKIAFVEGRYAAPFHGFLCHLQDSPDCPVWGVAGNESAEWRHLQPEKCRHVLETLMPGVSTQPLRQDWNRRRFFFSGTPYGDFDEVPAEASADYLKQYSLLAHLGWNTMIADDYEKLLEYVENGGTLLIGLPQFSRHVKRDFLHNMANLNLWNEGDLKELCGVCVKGAGKFFSGKWNSLDTGLIPQKEPVMSAMPSHFQGEDGPCHLAEIELAGAEAVVVEKDTGLPLVTRYYCHKGCVYLLCAYAYFGHEALQQLSANILAALAEKCLPVFSVQGNCDIFWNVWEETADVFRINILNTDWTVKGKEAGAVIYGHGLSVPVKVREREILTATWANGCLFVPDSPTVFAEVLGRKILFHGDGLHLVRVCHPKAEEELLEVNLTHSTFFQYIVKD